MKACFDEADVNASDVLPLTRTRFFAPLVVAVRSSRTTAFVAKIILLMLSPSNSVAKVFRMFECHLFYRPVVE
jgi:hypothetical protein